LEMQRTRQLAFPTHNLPIRALHVEINHAVRIHEMKRCHHTLQRNVRLVVERRPAVMRHRGERKSHQHQSDLFHVASYFPCSCGCSTHRSSSRIYRRPPNTYSGTVTTKNPLPTSAFPFLSFSFFAVATTHTSKLLFGLSSFGMKS